MSYRNGFFVSDFLGIKNDVGKNLTEKDLPKSDKKSTPQKKWFLIHIDQC